MIKKIFLQDSEDQSYSYEWLSEQTQNWIDQLLASGIDWASGVVVSVVADYDPYSISLMQALMHLKAILVLHSRIEDCLAPHSFIETEFSITHKKGQASFSRIGPSSKNFIYQKVRDRKHAGLVLLTSGTEGFPKGIVHDFDQLWLSHCKKGGKARRTIPVMKMDHIGGLNTLLSCLASQSSMYIPSSLNPFVLGRMIEKYKVQLLPATPSFLKQILIARHLRGFDLQSLECITYGAEPASQNLLIEIRSILPRAILKQTYGLSEAGILSTRSVSSDSLYFQILQDPQNQFRIVDGELQIKNENMMLGYLNADQPFTNDGWLRTKDQVHQKEGALRIIGRQTDMINVGGNKVYPSEIENIISELDFVDDVTVVKLEHSAFGEIIQAKVVLRNKAPEQKSKLLIKNHCALKMEKFKVPVLIQFVGQLPVTARLKKDHQI